jgi:hypothetical protein
VGKARLGTLDLAIVHISLIMELRKRSSTILCATRSTEYGTQGRISMGVGAIVVIDARTTSTCKKTAASDAL